MNSKDPSSLYGTTERIFRLLHLLTGNNCTKDDIFEQLRDYYQVDEDDDPKVRASSQRAGRMLRRDLQFLDKIGYQVNETHTDNTTRYSLEKSTGPNGTFLFNQTELDALVLLHTLFADPTKYTQTDTTHSLPVQPARNPFAEEILLLVERLAATLPAEQKKYFDRWVRKPFVYFNVDTVTDYLPHRITIDVIVKAISHRQQIQFEYAPLREQKTPHEYVDPYYIVHQDGHLYLIAYDHGAKREGFLEFRIDRINAESIKIQPNMIDGERQRRPIEFRAIGLMAVLLKVVSVSAGWHTLLSVKNPSSTTRASKGTGYLCERKPTTSGALSSNYISMETRRSLSVPPNYARRCGKRWRGCTTTTKSKNVLRKLRFVTWRVIAMVYD